MELLSPAGDLDVLKYAIYGEANAIYVGGKNFGARAFAKNFSLEDLTLARKITKLYGVKLYVTVNTLIYDNELEDFIDYIRKIHKIGIDAIIVQDIGMINLIKSKFPNLEIHASTQVNTHNKNTLEILKDMGVSRIVFAREVSLDEINNISTEIEKEIFVHGSLCVSYSGCCLLSSYIGGRSGNRGLCAGSCRLPFELYQDNKKINTNGDYLLSMKDLYTLDRLEEILSSNIDSLKIEGRMKSKEYVYYVTKIYRKYINMYNQFKSIKIDDEDIELLKILFNRKFTNGYLFNEKNNVNIKTCNNIGIYAGKVIESGKFKCKIKYVKKINKGDGLRIIYDNKSIGLNVTKVDYENNNILTIYTNRFINKNSLVYITSKNNISVDETKIDINIDIKIENDKIIAHIYNNRGKITLKKTNIISKAIKNPTSNEIIEKQIRKCGNTVFNINKVNIENSTNNIFINIKDLNDFRRYILSEFENYLCKNDVDFIENNIYMNNSLENNKNINYNVLVNNEEQLNCVLKYNFDHIYVNKDLYYKYKNKYNNLVLVLPRINKLDLKLSNERILIRELGSLKLAKDNYCVSDYTLNVTNSYTYNYLINNGVKKVCLSTEISPDSIKLKKDLEVLIYGNIELLITKYCVIRSVFNKNKGCNLCRNSKFYIKDRKGSKYRLLNDGTCNIIILSDKAINKIKDIEKLHRNNINNFRLNFYDESIDEIKQILKLIF